MNVCLYGKEYYTLRFNVYSHARPINGYGEIEENFLYKDISDQINEEGIAFVTVIYHFYTFSFGEIISINLRIGKT